MRYESVKKEYKVKDNNLPVIDSKDFGIVIETSYNDVTCLYNSNIIKVKLDNSIKGICNQLLFTGDKVVISDDKIIGILKRDNILSRDKYDYTKLNSIKLNKVIAVNIDIAVIVVSASTPPLHPKLIDRYMILLENAHIPYIVVLNKCDLISSKDEEILDIYRNLGIEVIKTSTINGIGIDILKNILKGKRAIFLGHSGVGKSSLTKEFIKDEDIRIGNLNKNNMKGAHTTTTSTYYEWDESSSIIDTPGIRSLDISKFPKEDIQNYYQEFLNYKNKCKYDNCLHYKESINDCEIKRQVEMGNIKKARYESYYKIISELK